MHNLKDIAILRDLAKEVANIAAKSVQNERRKMWSQHNSLKHVRPPIYIRWGVFLSEVIDPQLQCEDSFYRQHERYLRHMIFQDTLDDDFIVEPWITQSASYIIPKEGVWGVKEIIERSSTQGGAFHVDSPIKELDDFNKLLVPKHQIDEVLTTLNVEKLKCAIGDIIEVNVDRLPYMVSRVADISGELGYLRGIEQVMWDMMDNEEWLHRLLAFMRDGILKVEEEAEVAGDWHLCDHHNQSMPYSLELQPPRANSTHAKRKDLWGFMAAQELALVSPMQHDEFMLQYQIPIMEKFGLVSYGCCEDLTKKIDILRKIPNLRRIAVSPWADVASCAEQIGNDYVCSWRPSPSETVCTSFDEDRIIKLVKSAVADFRRNNCIFDVCLKDVQTVQGDPRRIKRFVEIVKDIVDQ